MKPKYEPMLLSAEEVKAILARCTEDGDCLSWPGATDGRGMPIKAMQDPSLGKRRSVSLRSAIARASGLEVSAEKRTAMTCGNRLCMNPAHMKSQTMSALVGNAAKRDKSPWRSLVRRRRLSEAARQRTGKLSDAAVADIRTGNEPSHVYAERYGVKLVTVSAVRTGRLQAPDLKDGYLWAGLMALGARA